MCFMLISLPPVASAQDAPTAGLAVTSSSSVGLIWHLSDRVALRPELGFSSMKLTLDAVAARQTQQNLSPGISLLFYTRPRGDDFRPYFTPRYVYGRNHGKSTSTAGPGEVESTLVTHTASFSGGAEYVPHEHFGVFGEVGMSYSRSEPNNTVSQSWAVRSVVGAILYF